MSPRYLYPRLPRVVARSLLREQAGLNVEELRRSASSEHPAAAPAATGGTPVPRGKLEELARAVRHSMSDRWPDPVARADAAQVDRELGTVLAQHLSILPPDATKDGVWAFLSIVLLPDIAAMRFPSRDQARLLGGPRNIFRRPWERRVVLGELADRKGANGRPLGEDELVGIFERSRLARSRNLARSMALHILSADERDRSEYAREFAKHLRRSLALISVDMLRETEIESLVEDAGRKVKLD